MSHPSHSTRISDSSLYDEVCNNCGANDGRLGGDSLDRPCRTPLVKVEPPHPWPAPPVEIIVPGKHATVLIAGPLSSLLMLDHIKAGQYRFPGGRIEGDELPIVAAARELYEEIGVEAVELRLLQTIKHHVSGRDWVGSYFYCARYNGVPRIVEPTKHRAIRYMSLPEIQAQGHTSDYNIASAYYFPRG